MKKFIISLIVFTISIPYINAQDSGIGAVTPSDLFSGGNVILRGLMERDYELVLLNGEMIQMEHGQLSLHLLYSMHLNQHWVLEYLKKRKKT